ncbi:MAG: dienelactone hydrolase family protein [Woeseiaceae bacterium]
MSGKMNWLLATILAVILSVLTACESGTDSPTPSASSADRQGIDALSNADRGADSDAPVSVEPAKPVVAEMLPYAEVDEQLVYGYFAFPADMVDPLPGVIVIHERWGLDEGVRSLADRIAGQGFVVLAVDLYDGATATDIPGARKLMVGVVENAELANENIRQAYQFLIDSGQAPKIASLGWSFGGGWALNTAMLFPDELDATIIYYGQVTDSEERLAPVNAPILGLFGENDRGVPADDVRAFESTLAKLDKEFEIEIYADVGHAFADPQASNYNAEKAELAWERVVAFLNEHLVAAD